MQQIISLSAAIKVAESFVAWEPGARTKLSLLSEKFSGSLPHKLIINNGKIAKHAKSLIGEGALSECCDMLMVEAGSDKSSCKTTTELCQQRCSINYQWSNNSCDYFFSHLLHHRPQALGNRMQLFCVHNRLIFFWRRMCWAAYGSRIVFNLSHLSHVIVFGYVE